MEWTAATRRIGAGNPMLAGFPRGPLPVDKPDYHVDCTAAGALCSLDFNRPRGLHLNLSSTMALEYGGKFAGRSLVEMDALHNIEGETYCLAGWIKTRFSRILSVILSLGVMSCTCIVACDVPRPTINVFPLFA
jgi:hypothetical protein